jgi:hypothetical protein
MLADGMPLSSGTLNKLVLRHINPRVMYRVNEFTKFFCRRLWLGRRYLKGLKRSRGGAFNDIATVSG